MRRKLILGGLTLAVIVAGVIALAAFTAQVVNLTAHVEKDIAVEPVICTNPKDINTPCFVDPRGGDYGIVLPQEFYDKIIEVTLSNSFFEQSKYNDLAFDVLWECKQFTDKRDVVDNLTGRPTPDADGNTVPDGDGFPDCRQQGLDDSICAIDLDGDTKADTVQHCDKEKLDGSLRDHVAILPLLGSNCFTADPGDPNNPDDPPNTPRPLEKDVEYVATGFLDKVDHKCRYELKLFVPPCEGSFNEFTDPHPLGDLVDQIQPIPCHLADKDRDGIPGLRNPQDFDEFADLGDDFKIQVYAHSEAANKVLIYEGQGNGGTGGLSGSYNTLKAFYVGLGYATDYGNAAGLDADLSDGSAGGTALGSYKLIVIACPTIAFTAAEAAALAAYTTSGGRIALLSDWGGGFCTADDSLLSQLPGVGITVDDNAVTPNNDVCAPLTDITGDQVTTGMTGYDPSATPSLTLAGNAKSLIRTPAAYFCDGDGDGVNDATGGATVVAVDQVTGSGPRPGSDVVVIGDENSIDDYGLSDPNGDNGFPDGNVGLAFNLVDY